LLEPTQMAPVSKNALWEGRILSTLPILFLLLDSVMKFPNRAPVAEAFARLGHGESRARESGGVRLSRVIQYVMLRPYVLHASLLSLYRGGAVASRVRVGHPWCRRVRFPVYVPVYAGVLVRAGLFLRESRLRALLPLRSQAMRWGGRWETGE